MKKIFCIVIPIYKEKLDPIDELSLKRLHKVIGNKYDIYLVKPESLDTKNYYKILKQKNVYEVVFDNKYFESTSSYSQLCLQYDFYDKFSNYVYMYIYQTDCYLVEDKLEEWCDKGYEYVGPPIISNNANWVDYKNKDKYEPQVGNGGFSLRKIEIFKDITDPNGELRKAYKLTDEQLSKIVFEDKYFLNDLYSFYEIHTPEWTKALEFGMDMNVDVIYDIMKFKGLPMGIHAWGKNIRHWQNVLEELKDNKKVINYCEKKYKEFFDIYYAKPNS